MELIRSVAAFIKLAFFFPLCWVLGGTFALVLLKQLGAEYPWPYVGYFVVGIGGTVWFAKS
ncbi:hypothetical protein HWQ46_01635 [Shewanella sp. D64]|uniref:hypothetical protein n=1 Tax=unclassified Shewanella TaxID=196818 RepID=UPI0022BA5F36|nr:MULTISPECIES: hypothetical protein [unclassified Shewanella]MEC4724248.1 hypothetical protein [Shewanella sp. D64]MEC4738760.1 hypothetical protein [Shewanella sp. E94]WBJ97800.1 hypothetical protein HWQ47_12220 [Shewanella sp. MTB7]